METHMTSSGPQRIAMGNPAARIRSTRSLRLSGQCSCAPIGVVDQSFSRTRRRISPVGVRPGEGFLTRNDSPTQT